MSHRASKLRVQAAERALQSDLEHAHGQWQGLKQHLRRAATPLRILGAGFASGVLVGFTAPLAQLGASPRLLQFVTQLATLVGTLQVRQAADEATDAAAEASAAAGDAGQVAADALDAVAEEPGAATPPPVARPVRAAAYDPDARLAALRRAGT